MKIHYFTREDLVSFGNYILSDARTEAKMQHPDFSQDQKEESLKKVSHADVSNWFDFQIVELAD
jgi:hypothetical protein